ncbi:hypothetical protein [Solibacillus sp. FSL H8-0538]|uniref:hypothetical protein n=1 Tax=Solibacillus sp. FSL H8-0538 TaxID=2921400 RepID=UPI0030F72DFA
MHNQLIVQKKLNYYMTYVKNLILSFSEEVQVEKIHYRRITPIIDRMFSKESEEFLNFFNGEENKSWQLLQLMHQQGEILKQDNGYYSLLPARIVQFPSEETSVLISADEFKSNESYYGLTQVYLAKQSNYPVLQVDDYAYRSEISDVLPSFEKKIMPLNLEIAEYILFIGGRHFKTTMVSKIKEGEWFIAIHETAFKRRDIYIAVKRGKIIYGTHIPKSNYRRIFFALLDVYGIDKYYIVKPLKNRLVEISFNRQLPIEEISLLNLIALPNCLRNPKKFITHEVQLNNVRVVIEKLNLKERV